MTTKALKAAAAVIVVAIGSLAVAPADAGVRDRMREFFQDSGIRANVTGPQAYQGQESGYYTGGNIYARVPSKNANLVNIQLPSMRAGCGGIDAFSGAFSFINAAQLVATLKAIASNAPAFAFELALETISPVIAEKMGELNDLIQKINQANINSCETAQALVGGLWPASDRASKLICEKVGNSQGIFADFAASRHGCSNEGRRTSTLNAADSKVKEQIPINKNLTWEAIKKNDVLNGDTEMRELMMTIAGTVILTGGGTDDAPQNHRHISPQVINAELISALLDGDTNVMVYGCGTDTDKCLNPTDARTKSIYIAADAAFKPRVRDILLEMVEAIRTNRKLTATERNFLNMTSLPVYKMLNVYTAYQGLKAEEELPKYAEIIAIDLVSQFISEGLKQVEEGGNQVMIALGSELDTWKRSLRESRKALAEHKAESLDRVNQTIQLVQQTQFIESLLASRLTGSLSASLGWSRAMARQ